MRVNSGVRKGTWWVEPRVILSKHFKFAFFAHLPRKLREIYQIISSILVYANLYIFSVILAQKIPFNPQVPISQLISIGSFDTKICSIQKFFIWILNFLFFFWKNWIKRWFSADKLEGSTRTSMTLTGSSVPQLS